MGCAFVNGFKYQKSNKFELSALQEAAAARGILLDKVYQKVPNLKAKLIANMVDIVTQTEVSVLLDLPLNFFYHKSIPDQTTKIMMCGEEIRPCEFCGHVADFFCDAPIGDGRTCDLPLCRDHKYHRPDIGIDIDYCPHHKDTGKNYHTVYKEG